MTDTHDSPAHGASAHGAPAQGTSRQAEVPGGERTFDALPPARGRGFTQTWWGARWLKALEDTALDAEQLRHGRRFARQGSVGGVSVRPGRITAVVRDRDGTPHRADVLLRELSESEWDRLLEVIARESGHIAALLDREMPPRLVEDAESVGVELLPGIGDLDPTCGCDAWDHCPHTAALCYQMARLLDQDPFVLLLLRGRPERELLDDVGLRSAVREADATAPDAKPDAKGAGEEEPVGVPAAEAFALGALLPPLHAAPQPVRESGAAHSLDGGDRPASGLDTAALEFLASDAALRAQQMLREALAPDHAGNALTVPLTQRQDAVRMAAAGADSRIEERLSAGCRLALAEFRSAVRAWELGGAPALAVWEERWTPDPEAVARARDQLAAAFAEEETPPVLHVTDNRWSTAGDTAQLRRGRDGRWWPYCYEGGTWWPAGGAEHDPAAALAIALGLNEPA